MTRLQSTYPKKFHNQFFEHELHTISPEETTQSITQIV